MNHTKQTEAEAGAVSVDLPARITVGMLIVLGGGLGLIAGLLFGDLLLGMLSGAGIGILIGALSDMWRRPVARTKGK
jgi:uncharacterized membrane protein